MNRWMYYLIGLRFKSVGQQQMYRKPSVLRKAVNIICYILSAIFLGIIFAYGGFIAFLVGGLFFGVILAFFSSMSVGKDLIYMQYLIANEQIKAEKALDFNHKLVKLGYLMSFLPIYVIMTAALLIPGGYLWFIPWFPLRELFPKIMFSMEPQSKASTERVINGKIIWNRRNQRSCGQRADSRVS